jgi:uncharacterized protein (DUF58 family)
LSEQPFDELFLRKLEQLRLRAKPLVLSRVQGERSARRAGRGSDFLDFRDYVQGDDLRYADWSVFARLDRLVIRQFHAEQNVAVHLLIDTSQSMGFGEPQKLGFALRLAAAIAYIGLSTHDRIALGLFDSTLRHLAPPTQGKRQFVSIVKQLSRVFPAGQTDMRAALSAYAERSRSPGLAIVIGDFLEEQEGYREGLLALARRGFETRVLHILTEEELTPRIQGAVRLVDIESGQELEIDADEKSLRNYTARIEAFHTGVHDFCSEHAIAYQRITTDRTLEDALFGDLRERRFFQ